MDEFEASPYLLLMTNLKRARYFAINGLTFENSLASIDYFTPVPLKGQ
jgi:hypothetical protein